MQFSLYFQFQLWLLPLSWSACFESFYCPHMPKICETNIIVDQLVEIWNHVRWRNLSYSNWDINSYPSELIGVLMWVENLQIYQWTFILSTFDHFLRICSFVMIYCLICESMRKHRMMQKLIEFVLKFGFWLLDFEFESVSWV